MPTPLSPPDRWSGLRLTRRGRIVRAIGVLATAGSVALTALAAVYDPVPAVLPGDPGPVVLGGAPDVDAPPTAMTAGVPALDDEVRPADVPVDRPADDVGPQTTEPPPAPAPVDERLLAVEPYWPGADETQVRLAAAVVGVTPGSFLTKEDSDALIADASRDLEDVLALANTDRLSVDALETAAAVLGVDFDRDDPLAGIDALSQLARTRIEAVLILAGVDTTGLGERDSLLDAAYAAHGIAPADGAERLARLPELYTRASVTAAALRIAAPGLGTEPGAPLDLEELARLAGHHLDRTVDATRPAAVLAAVREAMEVSSLRVTSTEVITSTLVHHHITWRTTAGLVHADVLTIRPDDPRLAIRTDWTSSPHGRANVLDASRAIGAVAAINGGFWVNTADPDGLFVRDGVFLSDTSAGIWRTSGIRSAIGIGPQGVVVGNPRLAITIRGDVRGVGVPGLNRRSDIAPGSIGDVVLHTEGGPYRPTVAPRAALTLVLRPTADGPNVASALTTAVDAPVVVETLTEGAPVPADGAVLIATGDRIPKVAAIGPNVLLDVSLTEAFRELDAGLTGGPVLIVDGTSAPEAAWRAEGFAPSHTDFRHPRSFAGVDAHGSLVLVAVDGRQARSVGLTQAAAGRLAAALGLVDATMLDGGGSTQMVIGGDLANVPCCDRVLRAVATFIAIVER